MKTKEKKYFEYIIVGMFLLILAIVFMPIMHNNGFSMVAPNTPTFQKLAEYGTSDGMFSLYSIGVSGINKSNITYVGTKLLVNVSLVIPSQYVSTAWNPNATTMINTQCASFVFDNHTKSYIFESNLTNQTTTNYNYRFNTTINSTGYYGIGGVCESESTTWNNSIKNWTVWSSANVITLQVQPIDVIISSKAPITQEISINNVINNIITSIENFIWNLIKMLKG